MSRTVSAILSMMTFISLLFAGLQAVILFFGTEPNDYIWAEGTETAASEVCDPIILDRPIYSMSGLANFATEAVLDLNDYDYLNWDSRLPAVAEQFFTPAASRTYYTQFERSSLLRRVQRDYFTVQAQLARPAIITEIDTSEAQHSWTVQVPVRVFYLTGGRTVDGLATQRSRPQLLVYTVRIAEVVPSRRNARGIAIADISAAPVNNIANIDRMLDANG